MSKRDFELEQAVQMAIDEVSEDDQWYEDEDSVESEYLTPLGVRGGRREVYHDFHKVDVKKTNVHVYTYVNGDQFTVTAGQDGVTQELVDELNRAHNRNVDSNCKNCLQPKTEEEKAEEAEEDAEMLALGLKPKQHKSKPILSLNGFLSVAGDEVIDSLPCFADPETLNGVEGMLGLCESPLIDALQDAIDALPPIEKRALQLVWLEGYPITTAAKMEGCRHESTLRMRVKRALARLGNNEELQKLYFKS